MPKELIATRTETDNAPDGTVLETRTDSLYVAWGRQPGADGEAVQVTIRQETDQTGRELYSAGLTRDEINDLIRVLKRARRQAFPTAHDKAVDVARRELELALVTPGIDPRPFQHNLNAAIGMRNIIQIGDA